MNIPEITIITTITITALIKVTYYYKSKGRFWFRIFGKGLSFDKKAKFSQRLKKKKTIFGYYITVLK